MLNDSLLSIWKSFQTKDALFYSSLTELVNKKQIDDAFISSLGLYNSKITAKMGAKKNNLNELTIMAIVNAFSNFLLKNKKSDLEEIKIIIGHDNRFNSSLFSETFSKELIKNNIKVYLFEENCSTPIQYVTYAIKKFNLTAGISISSSFENKKINQIHFFNNEGGIFNQFECIEIQNKIENFDYFNLNLKSNSNNLLKKVNFFNNKEFEKNFIDDYAHIHEQTKKAKRLKLFISNMKGSTEVINKILSKIGYNIKIIKHERINYKKINPWAKLDKKTYTASEPKTLNYPIFKAMMFKGDGAININQDGSQFSLAIKHNWRFKYLSSAQLGVLYLKYILEDNKINVDLSQYYVLRSISSTSLGDKIASKHNVEIRQCFDEIVKEDGEKKKILLAYDNFNSSLGPIVDSFEFLIKVIEMMNFYKNTQNKDLYEKFQDLEKEYSFSRVRIEKKKFSEENAIKLFSKISSSTKIGKHKIVNRKYYFQKNSILLDKKIELYLLDKSRITVTYYPLTKTLIYFIEAYSLDKSNDLTAVIIKEKELLNNLNDLQDHDKNITKKSNVIKYTIYLIIIAFIMIFLFSTIYKINGNSGNIFDSLNKIVFFDKVNIYIFASLFLFYIFNMFMHSVSLKRLLNIMGHNVKFRYLFIGSLIGTFLTTITPLAGGGGDILTYWYLRKKGIDRPTLYASLLTASLFYQVILVLATVIFLPAGLVYYENLFKSGDPTTIVFIVFLSAGTFFDIFGGVMIALITISKKFQNFVILKVTKFFEWMPFITLSDPQAKAGSVLYDFSETRKSAKIVFKKPQYILEQTFYRFLPWFVNPGAALGAIIFTNSGLLQDNLQGGDYFNLITGLSLARAANSISITPGGLGTSDIFVHNIFSQIFKSPNKLNLSSADVSSVFTLADKIINVYVPTAFSFLLFMTIFYGERHLKNKQNKEIFIKSDVKVKSKYYTIASIIWISIFIMIMLLLWFIP